MKTTEKIKKNKDKAKLKMREKIAIACFMEGLPSLISLWREKAPEKTFDAWLWEVYEFQKKNNPKQP